MGVQRGRDRAADTERRAEDIARQGGEEAADRKGWDGGVPEGTPGSHGGGVGNLPDRLWKPGRGGLQNYWAPLKFTKLPKLFLKGLWGSEGRGSGRGRTRRPPGGPRHLPQSRQPSVAPEPGRKQEVGNSRGRGERGRDGGSDGGARSGQPGGRWTHGPTGRPIQAPAPSPSQRTHTARPQDWVGGAAQPVPPGEGP